MSGSLILTPTDGAAGDWFGQSVSFSSDGLTAIVGGSGDDVGGNVNQGSARVFVWNGTSWEQRGGALTPTDGAADDRFGYLVSLSSDGLTAIVGGLYDDVGSNTNQGSARVFVWNGTSWVQRGGALTPTDGAAGDNFGYSVSLSSDGLTAIVGGLYDDVGSNLDQGSARVFVWNGTSWVQRGGALTPTDGAAGDYFGTSVSLSSDGLTAIVGGSGDDVGSNPDQGSARVFSWNGTSWVQRGGALTPTDGAVGDWFGLSVSLSSDGLTAIVGGLYDDVGSNTNQGSARVFVWNGTSWVQRGGALTPTDGAAGDNFGTSVSLSSDGLTAIVGGFGDDVGSNTNQGSARVFVWNGTSWVQRGGALTPTDGTASDFFGGSVSLSSDGLTAIVGGSNDDVGSNSNQGSARVFSWNGSAWIEGAPAASTATLDIAATSATKLEGNTSTTAFTFTVTRTGSLNQTSTVNWAVTGSGTNQATAADFVGNALPTGSITFAAGETSKIITIAVATGSAVEPDENFTVTLSGATAGTEIVTAAASGTILNDDAALAIAATSATKPEGNTGTTPFTFTVTRTGNTAQASTANWAVTGSGTGQATTADFAGGALPFGTVSFAAGETAKTVTINVAGDTAVEVDEGFSVTLSNASTGSAIQTAIANGIIKSDDVSGTVVGNALTDFLGGASSASWDYGFGTAGTSFTAFTQFDPNGHQDGAYSFFPAGFGGWSSSGVQTSSDEWNAIVAKNLTGADFYWNAVQAYIPSTSLFVHPGQSADTIIHYDFASAGAYRIDGRFSILSLNPSGVEAKIFLNGRDISASAFSTGAGVLNGPAATDHSVGGGVSFSWSGVVSASDNLWFAVNPAGWFGNDAIGFSATVTALQSTLSVAATSATKTEGNGSTTPFTFTVTRTGFLDQSSTANWAVTGSGTNPATTVDFSGGILPSGTVSFAVGETTKTITVQVNGDSTQEANEGFAVTLSSASAGSSITQATALALIQNDDARLSIAATSASKAEGNSGLTDLTFTVSRIGNTTQASTANWAVSGSGTNAASADDFANSILPSGTVNFLANETSKTITVRAKGDSTHEQNETFSVTLSAPSVGSSLGTATATGTILNDDASLSIAAASAIKAEGNSGLTNYTFTVTRGGNTTQASTANWAVSGSGTTKAVASDFENATLPTGTVSFAAGEASKTITIKVAGENLVEQDEGFTVTLSAASVGTSISTATATGLILNDDATVSIAATSAVKLEGHAGSTPMTFTVTRSGYTSPAATIDWAVTGSGIAQATADDFVGTALPTGTVSFKAGETSKTITVAVAGDTTVETNEGFKVTLATPSAGLTIGTASATGLIQNDDARLSIAATSANQVEGNTGATTPMTFTVTRSGYLTQATTANWAVTGTGNNAANGKDFTGGSLPTGTISFATGETSKTITVNVNGDTTVELAEQFTVSLDAPSTGAVITTATAIGTIQADDVASTGGDQFEGGAGVDTFNGLAGDDVFIGGGGADRLTGGLGADLFKYLGLGDAPYFLLKMETIKDFSAAQGDRIDLSAIDANAGTLFNDAFTFLGLADFSTTNATGQLIFDYNDDLHIGALFGSVNADAMPELAILLPGVSSLTAGSLIL